MTAVREESHLDDMRAAIRGDVERLESRIGTWSLMHVRTLPPVESGVPVDPPEPVEPLRRSWLARLLSS